MRTIFGGCLPPTDSGVTTTSVISRSLGMSNMVSSSVASQMARRPRAPVFLEIASRAISRSASSWNSRFTPSISNMRLYCFTMAFFGCVRISTRSSSVSSFVEVMTGIRPMNSGIMPNLCRSWGITWAISSSEFSSTFLLSSALKPMPFLPMRSATILSRPTKAPPQMKRMFFVLMWMSSCWGCLRPPWGGTLASVPSRIFRSACCTPSPETSRVIERFSALRAILSISSM